MVKFEGARSVRMEKINACNHERKLEVVDADRVEFDAITTGNCGGFDVWLEDDGEAEGRVVTETNHGTLCVRRVDIGLEDSVVGAGGLDRRLRIFSLPETLAVREISADLRLPLRQEGDNPLWISVFTEDGFQAWSSPIFAFRSPGRKQAARAAAGRGASDCLNLQMLEDLVTFNVIGLRLKHGSPLVHDEQPVGDLEREGEMLFDDRKCRSRALRCRDEAGHALDVLELHALGRLVEQDERAALAKRADEGQDLPLASAQRAGELAHALFQDRKRGQAFGEAVRIERTVAEPEIVAHRQIVEYDALLRRIAHAVAVARGR